MKIDQDRDSRREKSGLALPSPGLADGLEMEDFALELVSRARSQGVELEPTPNCSNCAIRTTKNCLTNLLSS